MIGNDTFCIFCHEPMRTCVMPAICYICEHREEIEMSSKLSKNRKDPTYSEDLLLPMSLWYHPKSDGYYIVYGVSTRSTNGKEGQRSVIYFSLKKRELHDREITEFLDGRFLPVNEVESGMWVHTVERAVVSFRQCESCKGTGRHTPHTPVGTDPEFQRCDACGGTGKIREDK